MFYMDIDGFIIHIKTEDVHKNIADDVEKWLDTSIVKMIKDHFQEV